MSAPLLRVTPVSWDGDVPDDAELIFTSAHGVRQSGIEGDSRRVYTVGDATALAARDAGFTNVVSAKGDWKGLLEIIEPTERPILHIHGETVRGALVERLKAQGLSASSRIVYRTEAVTDWPVDPADFDAVALYSPRAAETLIALPPRNLDHLTAYCLSENVAQPILGPKVRIAASPNEESLIACSRIAER